MIDYDTGYPRGDEENRPNVRLGGYNRLYDAASAYELRSTLFTLAHPQFNVPLSAPGGTNDYMNHVREGGSVCACVGSVCVCVCVCVWLVGAHVCESAACARGARGRQPLTHGPPRDAAFAARRAEHAALSVLRRLPACPALPCKQDVALLLLDKDSTMPVMPLVGNKREEAPPWLALPRPACPALHCPAHPAAPARGAGTGTGCAARQQQLVPRLR